MKLLALVAVLAVPAFADRAPITAKPIKTLETGRVTQVTVNAGADQGITAKDTCQLVDNKGVVAPVTCAIVKLDARTTIVETNAPPKEIRAELLVRFQTAL